MNEKFYNLGDNYTIKKIFFTIIQFILQNKHRIEQLMYFFYNPTNKTRLLDQNYD